MAARSPNYPALSLPTAIEMAEKLWKKEQRTAVSPEVAVKAFGFGALSGPARVVIGAMRKYGLLDKTAAGIKLSELALKILHPESLHARQEAIREAAMKPELFKELSQTHASASDDALKSYLINRKRFGDTGTKLLIAAFRDTMALANGDSSGYSADNGVKEPDRMAEPITPGQTQPNRPTVQIFSWPLAKDVTAEVRLTGGAIKPAHLERLRQYLDLAKAAVGTDDGAE
jgi:hypothetical protein